MFCYSPPLCRPFVVAANLSEKATAGVPPHPAPASLRSSRSSRPQAPSQHTTTNTAATADQRNNTNDGTIIVAANTLNYDTGSSRPQAQSQHTTTNAAATADQHNNTNDGTIIVAANTLNYDTVHDESVIRHQGRHSNCAKMQDIIRMQDRIDILERSSAPMLDRITTLERSLLHWQNSVHQNNMTTQNMWAYTERAINNSQTETNLLKNNMLQMRQEYLEMMRMNRGTEDCEFSLIGDGHFDSEFDANDNNDPNMG